jgi:FkbM family methyltransferase
VSDGIRRTGDYYEAPILDYLAQHHPMHDVIVDAGAMVGNHTAYFAAYLQYSAIHAFEPVPSNLELLRSNVAAYPSVVVHPVALSDRPRWLQMSTNTANMGACLVQEAGELLVEAVALDGCQLGHVTLLKVDVENHEAALLAGARRTLGRDHPLVLLEDWSYGGAAALLPGYVLEQAWDEAFTYLYRWP